MKSKLGVQWIAGFFVIVCLTGCFSHVRFKPIPPPSAPKEERVQAYKDLAPRGSVKFDNGLPTLSSLHRSVSLVLKDRVEVYYPEDLLPLVNANSDTAYYATRALEKRNVAKILWGTSLGAAVMGTPFFLAGLTQTEMNPSRVVGIGIWSLGGAAFLIGSIIYSMTDIDREKAFLTFDFDLRDRLGLEMKYQF